MNHSRVGICDKYKGPLHVTVFLARGPRLACSHPSEPYPPPPSPSMHSAGLLVLVQEALTVLTAVPFWQICILVVLLLVLGVHVVRRWASTRGDDMPISLNSPSISSIVPFVRNRYDFLNWGFHSTGETVFRFRLFHVRHFPHHTHWLACRSHVCFIEIGGGSFRRKWQVDVSDRQGFRYPPWFR